MVASMSCSFQVAMNDLTIFQRISADFCVRCAHFVLLPLVVDVASRRIQPGDEVVA
jgi:hypothetical protein